MRLFIAVDFPENIKNDLDRSGSLIRSFCRSGNFTVKNNYHITLVFLGETEQKKLTEILKIMNEAEMKGEMNISIDELGSFRNDGELLVRFAKCSKSVYEIRDSLADAFIKSGFPIDRKPLKPHITMARKAILNDKDAVRTINGIIAPLSFSTDHITLMRSDRTNGKLTYTPVYSRYFDKQ